MTDTISPHAYQPQNVEMLNGQTTQVQTDAEAEYYTTSKKAYLSETKFTDNTDLRDLDRLLVMELMVFRWQQHMFSGYTYEGDLVDDKRLVADIKSYSDQINKIKDAMGLTKRARDDAANSGDFATWFADAKARAKLFGVHRENQLRKALELMNELFTIVGTFDRSDEEERRKIGWESEHDILDWVRKTMRPEYEAVDEHFRTHEQRYWVRKL